MSAESIRATAVLGLGTMGHGIAQVFALAGYEVRAYDEVPRQRETLLERIRGNLERMVDADLVDGAAVAAALRRISVCSSEAEAVAGAEYVTEAVSEDLALKQALFRRLEGLAGPLSVLASNTSSYPMTQIAAAMERPERAIVTHWFNPPHIVPVVEVVPGENTAEETTRLTSELLARIGKIPVRVNQEIPGFLVNRVQIALMREVLDLLERGIASAEDIDKAICGSMGMRLAALGPLAIIDFAGVDITARVYRNLVEHLRSDRELPGCMAELVEAGKLGTKSGAGLYDYPEGTIAERTAERDRRYLALVKLLHSRWGE